METEDPIPKILEKPKTIAVIGCSKNPAKDAHEIPRVMQAEGYRIIPINPTATEILGEKSYPTLADLPADLKSTIDIINVFRPSEEVAGIVNQVIALKKETNKAYVIWMQLGIHDNAAAKKAEENGLIVIQNKCLKVEYYRENSTP